MLTTVLVNFNHGRFLAASLGSLLAQRRLPDELIVIDDVSRDNSAEVITAFLPKFPNARLIQNPVNQGVVANMNDGLRAARGTVVHFAASDDVFYPRLYEVGMALMEAHPSTGLFSARSDIVDVDGHRIDVAIPGASFPLKTASALPPAEAGRLLANCDSWFMGNTALFRRKPVLDAGGFPPELLSYSDNYICQLMAFKYGVCFSPETLAGWRRLDDGFSSSISKSPEKVSAVIAAVARKMEAAADIFAPSYVRRWKGRAEYVVKRQAITRNAIGSLTRLSDRLTVAALLWRLRPFDVARAILRRMPYTK